MKTIGLLAISIIVGAFYTFTFWKLWGWFAVPLGAPLISFLKAWGVYTLGTSVLIWSMVLPKMREDAELQAAEKVLCTAIILLEGWVIHLLMI